MPENETSDPLADALDSVEAKSGESNSSGQPEPVANGEFDRVPVDLKQPEMAALFAWLWPGAGHLYQGRYAKGMLFMICILGTFFFGLIVGEGRVVYASMDKLDRRWQYALQVGVGIPALPAIYQTYRVRRAKQKPAFGGWMAPPQVREADQNDELADIHEKLKIRFELGTLYTVVAGLLNFLAIYDAFAGPMWLVPENQGNRGDDPEDENGETEKGS